MLIEGFARGAPAEGLAGTTVESCGDSREVVDAVSVQVRTLGELLAEQAVRVLVRPSLPRAARVTEVDW
jgi:hypothetical protein